MREIGSTCRVGGVVVKARAGNCQVVVGYEINCQETLGLEIIIIAFRKSFNLI